jgi:N-carbamoyl-L-amino-acid hydrolase
MDNDAAVERRFAEEMFERINRHTKPGAGEWVRPSYSTEETAAMKIVEKWALKNQLQTEWDCAGNLHVTNSEEGPEVAMGSHLDSVPNAGRYDGVAGVVAAMCVMKRHHRSGIGMRLIVCRGEESAWFGKCYLGSLGLFGKLPASALDLRRRDTNLSLSEHLLQIGGSPTGVRQGLPASLSRVKRFYEVHIEQGPVLVEKQRPVGIVTAIRGNHRYLNAKAVGKADHSGTTPTHLRVDAVLNFARFLCALDARIHDDDLVQTSGVAMTNPAKHSVSTIADDLTFTYEFRSTDADALLRHDDAVHYFAKRSSIELGDCQVTAPVVLDGQLHRQLAAIASEVTGHAVPLPSGAGHDAAVFQQNGIPTGMIFIRNENGSHNPNEAMDMDDFMIAVEVLSRAVLIPYQETDDPNVCLSSNESLLWEINEKQAAKIHEMEGMLAAKDRDLAEMDRAMGTLTDLVDKLGSLNPRAASEVALQHVLEHAPERSVILPGPKASLMFGIGSPTWPGVSKVSEEAGEVIQVIGKLTGTGGLIHHWDGTNLRDRLTEETADVLAACDYLVQMNQLDVTERRKAKFALFMKWHDEAHEADMHASKGVPADLIGLDMPDAGESTLEWAKRRVEEQKAAQAATTQPTPIQTAHPDAGAEVQSSQPSNCWYSPSIGIISR